MIQIDGKIKILLVTFLLTRNYNLFTDLKFGSSKCLRKLKPILRLKIKLQVEQRNVRKILELILFDKLKQILS